MKLQSAVERIAVSTRLLSSRSGGEASGIENDWFALLETFFPNAAIFLVPNRPEKLEAWLLQVEPNLIVLSGGEDLGSHPNRDATEFLLIENSGEVPILGVCRGMQVLNTFFGGDLKVGYSDSHVDLSHEVSFLGSDGIKKLSEPSIVRCFHRNFIFGSNLSPEFQIVAVASDQSVEAMRHRSKHIIGVQWHPERARSGDLIFSLLINDLFGWAT